MDDGEQTFLEMVPVSMMHLSTYEAMNWGCWEVWMRIIGSVKHSQCLFAVVFFPLSRLTR